MIVFEDGEPLVRIGEAEIAGRRIAARALPYVGEVGAPAFRFDPVERSVVLRAGSGRIETGPAHPESWRRAFARAPAGPVLIGPAPPAEAVRGAARAAAEGAGGAGRGVYLLDPVPEALPDLAGNRYVALFCGIPDEVLLANLSAAALRMSAGLLLPVIPGWTAEESSLEAAVERSLEAGARFVAGIALDGGGESRRRVVQARGGIDPAGEEGFFHRVHHGDWAGDTQRALTSLRRAAAARGVPARPPRPRGDFEPPANAAAAARLEEMAEEDAAGEHQAALLRASVRWIDELGRDLRPVVAEGNFRKVFPFGAEIAADVEQALRAAP